MSQTFHFVVSVTPRDGETLTADQAKQALREIHDSGQLTVSGAIDSGDPTETEDLAGS